MTIVDRNKTSNITLDESLIKFQFNGFERVFVDEDLCFCAFILTWWVAWFHNGLIWILYWLCIEILLLGLHHGG